MDPALLPALLVFAAVSLFTPGPNNLMLMASGANWGLRRTLPHLLGVAAGFPVLVVAVGLGLAGLLQAVPGSQTALKVASVAYLLWLAWKIGSAAPEIGEARADARPLTFLQAAAFQWVNPKGWAMALGALGAYTTGGATAALAVAAIFLVLGLPSAWTWTVLGERLRRLLTNPARLRAFNWAMAALLVLSVLPVLWP
jgi:threonine/homoserine/homoserine lactone efflux protein